MTLITSKRTVASAIILCAAGNCLAAGTGGASAMDIGTVVLLGVLGIPVVVFSGYAGYLLVTGKSQRQRQ